jgi:hypothetical protein
MRAVLPLWLSMSLPWRTKETILQVLSFVFLLALACIVIGSLLLAL